MRHGASCFVVQCDSSSVVEMDSIVCWAHEHLPSINTIAHAAGVLDYASIADAQGEQVWQVAQPKVRCP